ncbi:MAG: hypothetical protein IKJ51_08015 [Clostridia bacterium]|nr:hypothetical protein [Clostridia bacterium]
MQYGVMKKEGMTGWHTWNVRSVLSHVHMPDGFALNVAFKEYREGHYLKETLVGRFTNEYGREPAETAFPGPHAFDDVYTEMTVRWCGMEISVESSVWEGDVCLLVTPVKKQVKPCMLVVEGGYLWGRPGYVEKKENMLLAHGKDREERVYITGSPAHDPNIPVQAAFLSVLLEGQVGICSGKQRTLEEICQQIARGKAAHQAKLAPYGEMADMYEAMECALGWDTLYDALHDRIVSPVSRLWSIGSGGYVLFCWDNFFAGFMASTGNKFLSYSNIREIMNEKTEDGFVPNFAYATGQKSADRSQPPVGSAMVLETWKRYRENWFVENMFDDLLQWNRWFYAHRMNESGALCWGSETIPVLYGNRWETDGVHATFGAALESGLDNSPMYDDIPFNRETNRLELEDVGLTGLYILDCRSLLELARIIDRRDVTEELEERLAKAEEGLERLWDEENGFYYNRRTDTGEFSRRISPTNFYALFSSRVGKERQRRMADEHYFNPEEFYGEWMLPSIARNDAAFPDQEYWRGRVWAPLNFLVYMALCRTELKDVRGDLAEKSRRLFMKEWQQHRHVHENYSAISGEGCDSANSDKFYHWGALLCMIALAEAGFVPGFGLPAEEK